MEKRIPIIGLVFLILLSSAIPISIGYNVMITDILKQSFNHGKTLYVGGSGPNNYTKIHDAINNASDGDTVFVYSGFYFENIIIEKSIILIGEDKKETIVDGKNSSDYLVKLKDSDGITVSSFTFINSSNGIQIINSNFSKISNSIIFSSHTNTIDYGIYCENSNNIIIDNNEILNFEMSGICLFYCSNCLVTYNIMDSALYTHGIVVSNKYTYNTITNTTNAVVIHDKFSLIEGNTIKNNGHGILIMDGLGNKIVRNNLISNPNNNAEISTQHLIKAFFSSDTWDYNYWDDLHGYFKFIPCYYSTGIWPFNEYFFPFSLNIDWHPAKEPYDIGV